MTGLQLITQMRAGSRVRAKLTLFSRGFRAQLSLATAITIQHLASKCKLSLRTNERVALSVSDSLPDDNTLITREVQPITQDTILDVPSDNPLHVFQYYLKNFDLKLQKPGILRFRAGSAPFPRIQDHHPVRKNLMRELPSLSKKFIQEHCLYITTIAKSFLEMISIEEFSGTGHPCRGQDHCFEAVKLG